MLVSQANITGVNFTVPTACPCYSVWTASATPTLADSGDGGAIETGVKVQANADGYILGVRFYKSAKNLGTHIGNLWSGPVSGAGGGNLLGTATFANETASGWQQVMFASPVPVVANTTYVASYYAPQGHYAANQAYFSAAAISSPPLLALQDQSDGGNGVYSYSAASTYPTAVMTAITTGWT